jgi:hypothetical protein
MNSARYQNLLNGVQDDAIHLLTGTQLNAIFGIDPQFVYYRAETRGTIICNPRIQGSTKERARLLLLTISRIIHDPATSVTTSVLISGILNVSLVELLPGSGNFSLSNRKICHSKRRRREHASSRKPR